MKKIKFYQALTSMCLGILSCSAAELSSIDDLLNEQQTEQVKFPSLMQVIHERGISISQSAPMPSNAQNQQMLVPAAQFVPQNFPAYQLVSSTQTILFNYPNLNLKIIGKIIRVFNNGYDFTKLNNLYGLIKQNPADLCVALNHASEGRVLVELKSNLFNDVVNKCRLGQYRSFWGVASIAKKVEKIHQDNYISLTDKKNLTKLIIECLKLNFTANEVDGRELWQNFSGKKFQITEMRGFIERLNRVDACLVPVPSDVFYKGEEDLACTLLSNFGGNLMILRNYITKTVIQHNDGTSFMVYSLCDIPISLESTLYEARFADIQPIYLEESAYSKFLEDAPHTLDLVSILTQELPSCLC